MSTKAKRTGEEEEKNATKTTLWKQKQKNYDNFAWNVQVEMVTTRIK